MVIGIYSGSFDPIHIGHAIIAEQIVGSGKVDRLWLMVSKLNPLKFSSPPASESHRMAMTRLVAEATPGVEASDFELSLPAPSYTYRTLSRLREEYPEHSFKLVIGADNWAVFGKWRNSDRIIEEFPIIIYPRPGIEIDESTLPESVEYLAGAPVMSVSSTLLRNKISKRLVPRWLIPEDVAGYIRANNLYSKGG